jgi:hypothetical protein
MASDYRGGYRGAKFPLPEHWIDAYSGEIGSAFNGHAALQGALTDEVDRKVAEIRADETLSPIGKTKAIRALATLYREHKTLAKVQADIAALRKREAKLREQLTTAPLGDRSKLSAYEAISLVMSERDTISELKAMPMNERMVAMSNALEQKDFPLLALALRERNLLSPAIAQRVQLALMRETSPDRFRELEHLSGKCDFAGQHDPLTGILPVVAQAADLFLLHLDEVAGIPKGETAALAAVDAATTAGAVTLSAEQAHDHQLWKLAYARAAEKNIPLRIIGDEGEGEIQPTPGAANGTADGGPGGE